MIDLFLRTMRSYRFSLSTEASLKREMAMVMQNHGIPFKAEYELDKKNRLDFLVDGYAVEVKIGGTNSIRVSAPSIYKQCERYSAFDQVKGVVLITNRAMGFPKEINQKPAHMIGLGSRWL